MGENDFVVLDVNDLPAAERYRALASLARQWEESRPYWEAHVRRELPPEQAEAVLSNKVV